MGHSKAGPEKLYVSANKGSINDSNCFCRKCTNTAAITSTKLGRIERHLVGISFFK